MRRRQTNNYKITKLAKLPYQKDRITKTHHLLTIKTPQVINLNKSPIKLKQIKQ